MIFKNSQYGSWSDPKAQGAQAAIQYAATAWGNMLVSNIEIKIETYWENLSVKHDSSFLNTLAYARASKLYTLTSNDPNSTNFTNTYYPIALVEKITGNNENQNESEIIMSFNSLKPWSFSLDKTQVQGKYDMVTITMHEIAHGLGFVSSAKEDSVTKVLSHSVMFPFIFDQFVEFGSNKKLTSIASTGSGTTTWLTSNNSFFNGPEVKLKNNTRPEIFCPFTWVQGSSMSHFTENYFIGSDKNALMTPYTNVTEIHHDPGEVGLAVLIDIGWVGAVLPVEEFPYYSNDVIKIFPNPASANIKIRVENGIEISELRMLNIE